MHIKQIKKIIKYPQRLLWAFFMEGVEIKRMVSTFVKQGQGYLLMKDMSEMPTKKEMREALRNLKEIPRILPFFILVVVPMPGVTEGYVLLAITLEKYLGEKISLLPTHFRKIFDKDDKEMDPGPFSTLK